MTGPAMVLHKAERVTLEDGRGCLVESTVYRTSSGPNYCARSWFGQGWSVSQTLIADAFHDDAVTLAKGPHADPRHLSSSRPAFELVGIVTVTP